MKRLLMVVLVLCLVGPAVGQEKVAQENQAPVEAKGAKSPKVFVETESHAETSTGWVTGRVDTKQSIISKPEIAERLSETCRACVITIKKEVADYVIAFAKTEGGGKTWSWIVYENKEGTSLSQGRTMKFNNAIKDASAVAMEHWQKEHP